ncbi:M48 family metalloprotease [Thermaurantiacus sp.]
MIGKRAATMLGVMLALALPGPAAAQPAPAGLSASERAQGAKVREQILREFGGPVEGPLADYVRKVASRVAQVASPGARPGDYSITVLDSPIPNAMATPGGYLYITRGLLALMNDEAELASVLGHEAGHVAARHSARSQRRATLATIGAIAATVLTGSDLVGVGAQVLGAGVLGQYSQKQEYEADTLGLKYLTETGYDPFATASMLAALGRAEIVERGTSAERNRGASWFSSHPLTEARVARAQKLAAETGVAPGSRARNRDAFLAAIDGMAWGDTPEQGLVRGTSFRHAKLGFGFDAPSGFRLQNSPSAVRGMGPDGSRFVFSGAQLPSGRTLDDIVEEAWRQLAGGVPSTLQVNRTRVNGLETLDTRARVSGRQGVVDAGITAYRWEKDSAFLFATQAPAGRLSALDSLLASFRRLSPQEAKAVGRGQRIAVVTVRPGDTVQSLASRMAFPDNQLLRFLALNGIENRPLRPGEKLKLIVDG